MAELFELSEIKDNPILFDSKQKYIDMLNEMIRKNVYTHEQLVFMQTKQNVDIEALAHYFDIVFHERKDKNLIKPWPSEEIRQKGQKIIDFRFKEKDSQNPYEHMLHIVKMGLGKDIDGFDETFLTNPEIVSQNFTIKKFKKLIDTIKSENNDFYKHDAIKKVIPISDDLKQEILFNSPKTQITDKSIVPNIAKDKNDLNYDIEESFFMAYNNGQPVILRLLIGRNTNGATDLDNDNQRESYIKVSMFPRGNPKLQSDLVRIDYKPTNGHPNKLKPDGTFMDDIPEEIYSDFAHLHFFDYNHTMLFPKNKGPNIKDIPNSGKQNFEGLVEYYLNMFKMPNLQKAKPSDNIYNKDDTQKVKDVYNQNQQTKQNGGMEL